MFQYSKGVLFLKTALILFLTLAQNEIKTNLEFMTPVSNTEKRNILSKMFKFLDDKKL